MKKILLMTAAILGTCSLFAQRNTDLQVKMLTPTEGQMYEGGDTLKIKIELKNLGVSDWIVGDTIVWSTNLNQTARGFLVSRTIGRNDTMLIESPYVTFGEPDSNLTADFCFLADIRNGANPIVDTNSDQNSNTFNNVDCKRITVKAQTVSIEDVNAAVKTMTVYPNPAANEIAFSADGFINKAFDVQIFDMTGRVVMVQSFKDRNGGQKVNIAHLNNGMYQIRIEQEGHRFIGKFLKQ